VKNIIVKTFCTLFVNALLKFVGTTFRLVFSNVCTRKLLGYNELNMEICLCTKRLRCKRD